MGRSSVLVITEDKDVTADLVILALQQRNASVVRCDLADFPQHFTLSAWNDKSQSGRIEARGKSLAFDDICGVYQRRPSNFEFPDGLSDPERDFCYREANAGFDVLSWIPAAWVNDPMAESVAGFKPRQLATARSIGMTIPATLVTNDPAELQSFANTAEGDIVYKTVAFPEIHPDDWIPTSVVSPADLSDASDIKKTMHLFQQRINKDYEVRLTVIGDQAFAAAIRADTEKGKVDWRTENNANTEPILTPDRIKKQARAYLDHFGLAFGAFDFIVTPDGEWVFLECNPSGQWAWQTELAQPIAEAIATHLTSS